MNRKEDKCRIEVQGEMTAERYASFTMLYVPLIGSDAAALYHTLSASVREIRRFAIIF